MPDIQITSHEYALFQRLIHKIAGLSLNDGKRVLLVGRLARRLTHYGLDSFDAYYQLVVSGQFPDELQTMVDLLTTNETYFFREPRHFEYLHEAIAARGDHPDVFRVWSAASSSGEEAYSIAMTLAESLPRNNWEVVGSDISARVLRKASSGHYSLARTEGIPPAYLRKYCLKGIREHDGTLLVLPELRRRVSFYRINLTYPIDASIGDFDVIFLRNVMIYFTPETKTRVVHNLLPRLKRGGHLFIGHSESLNGITDRVVGVEPTIYRKP